MTDEQKRAFVELIANGNAVTAACEPLGLTVLEYINARDVDTVFARDVDRAKRVWAVYAEDAVYQKALMGDISAQKEIMQMQAVREKRYSVLEIESCAKGSDKDAGKT